MAFATTMTFVSGVTTCTVPAPSPGYRHRTEPHQSIVKTWGGETRVTDRDVFTRVAVLTLVCTKAQRDALDDFFDNTVNGALTTFTWTDHKAQAHAGARFLNKVLDWEKTPDERFSVTLEIEVAEVVD